METMLSHYPLLIDKLMHLGRQAKITENNSHIIHEMAEICFELRDIEPLFKVKYAHLSDLYDHLLHFYYMRENNARP